MKVSLLLGVFCLLINTVSAQDRTVTGKVISHDNGTPIPGVNVVVKGAAVGTITDKDGNYKLVISDDVSTLIFSFIGLQSVELEIAGRSIINVTLESNVEQLSEVVITAYGVERASREITFQTDQVKGSELIVGQQPRAANALAGKVAGLQINVQDNGVNPTNKILLRGLRSISADNTALIVMDGVIVNKSAFDHINPNDIENISVLKGASAAATYGSAGANGAILITTKSGNLSERFKVGINSTTTFEQVAYMPDFQTKFGTGWEGVYDNIENTNWGPRFDGQIRQIGPDLDPAIHGLSTQMVPYAPVENNLRDFYETGKTYQNTIYLSGGDETGKFYMSFGNQNTTGIVPDDVYKRNTFRVNVSKKMNRLTLGLNSSYNNDEQEIVGSQIGGQSIPFYWFVLNTPTNIPLTQYKDYTNPLSYGHPDNYFNGYYENPYWAIGTNRNNDKSTRINANISIGLDITENITWTTKIGVNSSSGIGKNWRAGQEYDPVRQPFHITVSSFVEETDFKSQLFNGNSLVSVNYNLFQDFYLKAIVGGTFWTSKFRSSYIRANNLSIPGFYDISNGTGEIVASVSESEKRTFGFFGDITLGYRNFVFLNITGRQDYTSTLPKGNNAYFYPSFGASFLFTEAISALRDNTLLSYGKLTISNATVYTDLRPYQINERYFQASGFPFGSINGFELSSTVVDAGIEKEKLNTTEFGLNIGLFDSRISFDGAYFLTKTTNLITRTTPSVASGAFGFLTNIGELKGSGFELTLGADIFNLGDFEWGLAINYTSNETKVISIKDDLTEIAIGTFGEYGIYATVGEAFPQVKASSYVRDPQGRVVVDAVSGNPLVGDLKNLGKTIPNYIIGSTSSLIFKGISLTATVDYRTGHVYYSQLADVMTFTGNEQASVIANRENFVWPNSVIELSDGSYVENTNLPITEGQMGFWHNRYNRIKENYVRDASAFKIREVALMYELPQGLTNRTKVFSKVVIGFVAVNLYTWRAAENKFSDPEFNNNSSFNVIGVSGFFQSPPTRSFGFNINLEY